MVLSPQLWHWRAFVQLDYHSSIMENEGTQTRSRQLEEQVRAMRESMDKIQADLAEWKQQQSEEFQAKKQCRVLDHGHRE